MDFSIVTPSYQQLDWLALCIASVADQAGVSHEHIIQDAGTPKVEELTRVLSGDTRVPVRLYVEKDAGMYDAINRGLRRGTGDFCAYLNCDEQYLEGTLLTVKTFFERHPGIDVLFGDAILTDRNGAALSYRRTVRPTAFHTRLSHLNTLTCATFFRRSIVDDGFFFSPSWKIIGDAVWVDILLQAKRSLRVMPVPLSTFTFTGANLSHDDSLSRAEHARWRKSVNAPSLWLRPFAQASHRIHKGLRGAYRCRKLDYAIYTLADKSERTHFHAAKVGYRWPANYATKPSNADVL